MELYTQSNTQAAQIQYVNSVIMGLAQYLQPSICSHAYHAIDRRVNNTALAVWKNLFPETVQPNAGSVKELSNLPHGTKVMTVKPSQFKLMGNGSE